VGANEGSEVGSAAVKKGVLVDTVSDEGGGSVGFTVGAPSVGYDDGNVGEVGVNDGVSVPVY